MATKARRYVLNMTKICTKCRIEKDSSEFFKHKEGKFGLDCWCKSCRKIISKEYRNNHPNIDKNNWLRLKQDPRKELLKAARKRAKQRNRPFSISKDDIVVPNCCPILGMTLCSETVTASETSPSLDEVIVGKGYVRGNIQVISRKANTMKSNATPRELLKFADWIYKTYA